jgi:hypothetical protein
VDRNTGTHYRNPAEYQRGHYTISRREHFEGDASLTPAAAYIIVTLASLALWWTVWLAVFQLASLLWAHHA